MRLVRMFMLFAVLALPATVSARQQILKNGSMESGAGPVSEDPQIPAGWTRFGPTVERSGEANLVPTGAGHSLKAFSSDPQVGAYQNIPVTPGRNVRISASLYTRAADRLTGDAQAWIVLEFYNAAHQQTGFHPLAVLNSSSPADTWIPGAVGPIAAPANTAYARMTCVWTWNGMATGSAYWDDCRLTVDGGANLLTNGDFETAGQGQQSPFGIDDWTGFNDQEKSGDVAKHGTSSLKVGTSAAYSGLFQNMRTLSAGDRLLLRAYVWNPSSDPLTGSSRAGIKLEFFADQTVPPPVENLAFNQNNAPDVWTLVTINTTVPQNASIARIVCLYGGTGDTSGSVHYDGMFAERGSQPGMNQLLNPSFESGSGGANGIDNWTEFKTPGQSQCQLACFEVPAYHGDCTAKALGTSYAGVYQEITVTPGENLIARAYLYTPSYDRLTGSGVAGLKIEWAVGGVPPNVDIGPPGSPNTIGAGALRDTWLPLTIDYTMPPGSSAGTRYVNIVERASATSGRVYFDACEAVVLNRFNGADWDGDDDEDLADFAQLQRCFSGPGGGLKWGGIVFDADDDQDNDMADFNYFAPRMTGPLQ